MSKYSLNQDWRFFRGEINAAVAAPDYNHTEWEVVTLPHSVRIEPAACSGGMNYRGICWYRKKFYINQSSEDKKIFLEFEGAKHVARVFLNGKELETHYGGYLPFVYDITEDVVKDGQTENVLVVQLDNQDYEDVPPGKPQDTLDFCYFGGLYRNVWLYETNKVYITHPILADEVAGGGVFVHYDNVSHDEASVCIKTHIKNEDATARSIQVIQTLYHVDGTQVVTQATEVMVQSQESVHSSQMLRVKQPQLWSIDTPYLYTLETTIQSENQIYDQQTRYIGIRHIAFNGQGFRLNGETVKLIGANRHQEYVYIGDAVSDQLHERDARLLKEAGFNCIRTGHYPPGRAFMEACDRIGLVCVMPIPGWQWFHQSERFVNLSYENLRQMVRTYRNHPSLVLFEPILNETWYPEEYAKTTARITHEEYPTDQCYTAADADLPGGTYFDVPYSKPKDLGEDQCCFIREYGDNYREQFCRQKTTKRAVRGEYNFYPGGEEAMLTSAMERLVQTDALWLHRQIAGGCLWTGIDCNRGYMTNIAATGVVDLYRLPKFSYYTFASQKDQAPVVFAATYWKQLNGPLVIFSNCDEVSVTINGVEVARQQKSRVYIDREDVRDQASHFEHVVNGVSKTFVEEDAPGIKHPPFVFEGIKYEPGTLCVEGINDGKVVATHSVHTPKAKHHIRLEVADFNKQLVADGSDVVMLHVFVEDEDGQVVTDCYDDIAFEVSGEGTLIGDGKSYVGVNPLSLEAGASGVLIQSTKNEGKIYVKAHGENLISGEISFVSGVDHKCYIAGPVEICTRTTFDYDQDHAQDDGSKNLMNDFDRAKGKPVLVSSEVEGYAKEAITDGNGQTVWRVKDDGPQWIEIDLERKVDLLGCKIWWESDNNNYQYRILVSADRQNWEEVINRMGTGQDLRPDAFRAPQQRYVKVMIDKVSKDVAEICSIQVFSM